MSRPSTKNTIANTVSKLKIKKISLRALFYSAAALTLATSCLNSSTEDWDTYKDWREWNEKVFAANADSVDANGEKYYQKVVPAWNSNAEILVRFLNDRKLTEGNLSPLYNSTCYVKYIGRLSDGTPFDSSYLLTPSYGDSLAKFKPSSVVAGFGIALQQMRVGDSIEVVIPYWLGYQSQSVGKVLPYSNLVFNIKLVDIPAYEVPGAQ